MSPPVPRKTNWLKRIGWTAVAWAGICGLALFADMQPRPILLAGLCAAVSISYWMMADAFPLAQATDWHVSGALMSRPRGADARVVAIERLIKNGTESASARTRLQRLLSDLTDERLVSLRGINRRTDPDGARAALGPELDDFITSTDPDRASPDAGRIALLLNRIESI